MIMLPILETKLPGDLHEKWELELSKISDDTQVNFKLFFNFLEGHVLGKEARHECKNTKPLKPNRV